MVNLTSAKGQNIPPFALLALQGERGVINFLISPPGLLIIGCIIAAVIVSTIFLKKRNRKKEKQKKLPITWPNKEQN